MLKQIKKDINLKPLQNYKKICKMKEQKDLIFLML